MPIFYNRKVGDNLALTKEEDDLLLELLDKQAKQAEINKMFLPQPGPQTDFLNSKADITIYGGAAGGGKSFGILLSCLEDIDNPKYGAVIFRRTSMQVFGQGGLWDEAVNLYRAKGGVPVQTPRPTIKFPNGSKVAFGHLQHATDVQSWDGSQIPVIAFDELCHFERSQFIYLLSRNRSNSGCRNRVIASCNPDADSFVANLIEWYIDQDTGFPIPEHAGVMRYMTIIEDAFQWGDTREELAERCNIEPNLIKTFVFIPSLVTDNKILLKNNPTYLASLNALGTVQKGRLLYGNWKIKNCAGMFFKRDQVQLVNKIPGKIRRLCRAWDLAASIPTPNCSSPDATAGVLMAKLDDGKYIVIDVIHGRWTSNDVRKIVLQTAKQDKARYGRVTIRIPQDPGGAGKDQAEGYRKLLAGFIVKTKRVTGDKETRFEPAASSFQAGDIYILTGSWNDGYFMELEAFNEGKHDDRVDATSDSYSEIVIGRSWAGVIS